MKRTNAKKQKRGKKSDPHVGIVVPTIREQSIGRFLKEWEAEFMSYPNLTIFVVEDNPTKTFRLDSALSIRHYSWADIEKDLGKDSWIIPRRSDCIRSYGFYKAYYAGIDILITLDDDCYPVRKEPYLVRSFIHNLGRKVPNDWFNTLEGRLHGHRDLYPRGFPYKDRDKEVVMCHGIWDNIPDFDGQTQLNNGGIIVKTIETEASVIPKHVLFPMCGMNVAVKREIIPVFYFMLMGQDSSGKSWGMHRFGDIWAGIFSKKILDHLGKSAVTGEPVIHHDRASDPNKNVKLEKNALKLNDGLYEHVRNLRLEGKTYKTCYAELAHKLPREHVYFDKIKKAMAIWASLF